MKPLSEISIQSQRILGIIGKDEYLELYNADKLEKKNTVLICLHDPSSLDHPDWKVEGFEDVLQMKFWDVDSDIGRYKTLTQEQANELRDFIWTHIDKQFLIHCHAGQSRSAGVGMAIGTLLDNVSWEDNDIQKHTRYDPNVAVYNKITNSNKERIE